MNLFRSFCEFGGKFWKMMGFPFLFISAKLWVFCVWIGMDMADLFCPSPLFKHQETKTQKGKHEQPL